ncbi:hypothetical protein JRQ81_015635 [Phrynocephalus forsythii]|uniref:Uncharacterized protein n=1 Tax=Phrynocephalus forsythii TaxID=171643 RepID=A0A9Q0XXM0_9SAUR|nr:hypothetical protein JRQ81_015635 [Phrynocephalus forsythii]
MEQGVLWHLSVTKFHLTSALADCILLLQVPLLNKPAAELKGGSIANSPRLSGSADLQTKAGAPVKPFFTHRRLLARSNLVGDRASPALRRYAKGLLRRGGGGGGGGSHLLPF